MSINLRRKNQGFTIIEVMIVLAIAGLILLIVFLAIPALQRNSRNTQRKNDVAAFLAAMNEYANNNNGALPKNCHGTSPVTLEDNSIATETTSQVKMGYYNAGCSGALGGQGTIQLLGGFANLGVMDTPGEDFMIIVQRADCPANGNQAIPGSARQFVAAYELESGAGQYKGTCASS